MTKALSFTSKKTIVSSAKFEVEKFDGRCNFDMWQCEVLNIIYQQELEAALENVKLEKLDDKECTKINRQACGTIRLSHQRTEVPVYERDIYEHIVEGVGEQVYEEELLESTLSEKEIVLLLVLARYHYQ